MLKISGLLLPALLVLPLAGCDSNSDLLARLDYEFSLTENSTTVAEGRLVFDKEPTPGETVTGTFILATPTGEPLSPLAATSGDITGSVESSGLLHLSLAEPNMNDTGIELEGEYVSSGFEGVWGSITFVGHVERGTFSASPG